MNRAMQSYSRVWSKAACTKKKIFASGTQKKNKSISVFFFATFFEEMAETKQQIKEEHCFGKTLKDSCCFL